MATIGSAIGASQELTSPAVGEVIVSFQRVGVTPGRAVWASVVQTDPNTHQTVDDPNVRMSVLQVVPNYPNFGADVRVNLFKLGGSGPQSIPTTYRVSLFVLIEDP